MGARRIKREERANYVQLDIHGDFFVEFMLYNVAEFAKKRCRIRYAI